MSASHEIGHIQPFSAVLGYDAESERIVAASANLDQFMSLGGNVLGQPVEDVLGADLLHDIRNGQGLPAFIRTPELLGQADLGKGLLDASAYGWDDRVIVIMMEGHSQLSSIDLLKDVARLCERQQGANDVTALVTQLASLIRIMSGYDRVQALRLISKDACEVIAESQLGSLSNALGETLSCTKGWFTQYHAPYRIIRSIHDDTIPVISTTDAPLNFTLSPVATPPQDRLQYMAAQKIEAEFVLPLSFGDAAWGALLFQHRHPRLPSPRFRQVCLVLRPLLEAWIAQFDAADRTG